MKLKEVSESSETRRQTTTTPKADDYKEETFSEVQRVVTHSPQ